MQKIYLVPIDGSINCAKAIDFAVDLALQTGSAIKLLNVQPKVHTQYAHAKIGTKKLESYKLEESAQILEEGCKHVKERVKVISKVRNGLPAQEICKEAADNDIRGIILAPRKRKKTIGSVTFKVLQLTDTPVIILPG
ncbi:universal stress protein [Sediminibacillus albus]|uniref:Nucleotide-binding universal stress protein, UspA family n=1 Tax=Sediminibacillus albus TaxID=407036 RepID=A0A1G8WFK3_9BACI|nr:universal stress protein [Sediminibacillus albus]SDJ76320.1 Nucleotide-binding universal stress protein, UspA family [Sediminibacillus albus]